MQTAIQKKSNNAISPKLCQLLEEIGTKKRIEHDTYLFQAGMDANEIFLVKSGRIQIQQLTSEGKELTLRICRENDIVGELILYAHEAKYMLSAKVVADGEVLMINKDRLEMALSSNGTLTSEFMRWYSNHLRRIQSKQRDLLLNGKKGALYSTLIRLSNSYGMEHRDGILLDILLTNQDLADFCACTRENINRMLSELKKLNVISYNSQRKITIHDITFLRHRNGCDNCAIEICNID